MIQSDEMRGLIERIEAATADQQDVLILEAWLLTNPEPPRDWKPLPTRCADVTDEQRVKMRRHSDWRREKARITLLLANGGFIDAAMTLVPEVFRVNLSEHDHPTLRERGKWTCTLFPADKIDEANRNFDWPRCDHAQSAALALCAASLRALSTIEGYDEAALRCARRTMAGPSLCALPAEHAVLSHRQAAPPTQPGKALNMEATPEMIAMARRIARQASDQHSLAMTYAVAQTAALAAFIETTELAAKHAEKERGYFMPQIEIGPKIAADYRNLDHLKGPDDDQ